MPDDQNTTPAESENIQEGKQNPISTENSIPPSPETAQPEIPRDEDPSGQVAPELESPQSELAPEAPPMAVEAPRESENLEAVKDTSPQNTSVATSEPVAIIPTEQQSASVSAPTSQLSNIIGDLLQKAKSAIKNRKTKKLEKILVALDKKNKISNDEVQKLLNVSDATATRYLSLLEQQGKIKQAGRTGKYTFYTKI